MYLKNEPPTQTCLLSQISYKVNYKSHSAFPTNCYNVLGLGCSGKNIIEYLKVKFLHSKYNIRFNYDASLFDGKKYLYNQFLLEDIHLMKHHLQAECFLKYFSKNSTNILCVGLGGREGTFLTELISICLIERGYPLKIIALFPFQFETGRALHYSKILINELSKLIPVESIIPEEILKYYGNLPFSLCLDTLNEEFYSRTIRLCNQF